MSEETIQSGAGKGLGIAGLVVGIIALVVSFIPCLGMLALIPGVIALILSAIGVAIAVKKDGAKGIAVAALVISVIACGIAGWQTKVLSDAAMEMSADYDSCEELIIAYEAAVDDFAVLSNKMEDEGQDANILGTLGGTVALVGKIANIQTKSSEMECSKDKAYQEQLEEIDRKYSESQASE